MGALGGLIEALSCLAQQTMEGNFLFTILGMKAVGNGRENPITIFVTVFFCGNGNGNAGWECETENTGLEMIYFGR